MSVTISIHFLTGRAHLHPWQTHHSEGRIEWPPSHWRLLRAIVAVAGRGLASLPYPDFAIDPDNWHGGQDDEIPLSRLSRLLHALAATPRIWLPKTSSGHTRQYFPIHEAGMVKNTGSAVFDTFAVVRKDQPLLFYWPNISLEDQQQTDLNLILARMTYFGRAESWSQAEAQTCPPEEVSVDGISRVVSGRTHWECVCIEDHGRPTDGQEYRDYLLERRLAPSKELITEVAELLPRTKTSDNKKRNKAASESLQSIIQTETIEKLFLRCLLRESGQDIKDGLERPIGTRWVHYAVPRTVYDLPRPKPQSRPRPKESVDLIRYALSTATVSRPVLPALTDTLLVADRFRSAVMALCRKPGRSISGHEEDGSPSKDHQHAFWWPLDEDNNGFIDHVMVWAPGGFESHDVDALRRLTRLRQRGGRPDLLVTPVYVGQAVNYHPWQVVHDSSGSTVFVSTTPYFCPVHLSHGRGRSGRVRSLKQEVIKGLLIQGLIDTKDEVSAVDEIVFDFAPKELAGVVQAVAQRTVMEPVPPRQFFPVIKAPNDYPPLPKPSAIADARYRDSVLKDADEHHCFGATQGLLVDHGNRFIRALSFCRRRRGHELRGCGRMLQITFNKSRPPRPFAIGSQCHFGLGLFAAVDES